MRLWDVQGVFGKVGLLRTPSVVFNAIQVRPQASKNTGALFLEASCSAPAVPQGAEQDHGYSRRHQVECSLQSVVGPPCEQTDWSWDSPSLQLMPDSKLCIARLGFQQHAVHCPLEYVFFCVVEPIRMLISYPGRNGPFCNAQLCSFNSRSF